MFNMFPKMVRHYSFDFTTFYDTLRTTSSSTKMIVHQVGHDNLPRADRATGPLLSSQAGVKGSTSTYGTCQQTILVKTITSML